MATDKSDKLKEDYDARQASTGRFCSALVEQIQELISQNNISLAVPIENRVKSWSSISDKIKVSTLELEDILQINDLVGIRLILQFQRDLEKCRELIEKNLEIIDKEDTASRLDETQFGYQSYHYVVKLPKEWLSIPTFKDCAEYKAEIQVRTMAQHIWAVASHTLQYKQEDNVPKTVRRSIHRVSALLETVDLEFERVLSERENYVKESKPETQDETLNVDILKKILDSHLPLKNRSDSEEYAVLIKNLSRCGINKSSELIKLINEQKEGTLQEEAIMVTEIITGAYEPGRFTQHEIVRATKGIFYTHSGLIRVMLSNKFGERWKIVKLSGTINIKTDAKGKLTVIPKNNKENKPSNQP